MVVLVAALLIFNYLFYHGFGTEWSYWVQGAFLGLLILWGLLNLYTFPLLLEQSDRRLVTALRNSLVIYIRRPAYALGSAALMVLVGYLSYRLLPLWGVITASLSAYLANQVTIRVVMELSADRGVNQDKSK
jgi:uncharacterized membrane protein YesL